MRTVTIMVSTEHAREVLTAAVAQSKRTSTVRLPIDFARLNGPGDHDHTPLTDIAHDGRGEGLRLRVYLSIVMLASKSPHQLRPTPASAFAEMHGLTDPFGSGAGRVNKAQRWLRDHGYITREENGTHPPTITVQDVSTGYNWGARWITLPIELWQNGWINHLSVRALTMYVVLRELTGGRPNGATAPGRRKHQYRLSPETWARGTAELEELGLASVESITDRPNAFARPQRRNRYWLDPEGLIREPPN
jgi:hypothetical protein